MFRIQANKLNFKVCEFLNGTNGSPAVDIDEGDDDSTTALQIAASKGNVNLVCFHAN